MTKTRKSSRPNPRLDQSPDPRSGYPRTPEHEQREEQLHHEPGASATTKRADQPASAPENEGEGSRTAARGYDEKATEWARHREQVDAAAEAAEEAIDSSEATTLRKAEVRGKLDQHR